MRKISDSLDSTLGNWLLVSKMTFGDESAASIFLRQKIAQADAGFDEEVIADERQMLVLLMAVHEQGLPVEFDKPLPT